MHKIDMQNRRSDEPPHLPLSDERRAIGTHHDQLLPTNLQQLALLLQPNHSLGNEDRQIDYQHEGCKREAFECRTAHLLQHIEIVLILGVFYFAPARQEQHLVFLYLAQVLHCQGLHIVIV